MRLTVINKVIPNEQIILRY